MGDLLTSVQLGANGSSMSSETNGFESNESSVCTNLSTDTVSEHCRFWIQGILLCTVGVIGMIGNTVSIVVLSRPEMLSVFNQILIVMTAFDTIYLLTAIAEFSFVESFHLTSEWYDLLFVYFLYPLHNITLCCSIYSHVVLAFERYLAVCHPEMVYSTQTRTPHQRPQAGNGHASGGRRRRRRRNPAYSVVRKKVLIYIIPVVFFSVVINFSRWFELKVEEYHVPLNENQSAELGSNYTVVLGIAGTWLRYNQYYVTYYLHWTILLATGIFPLVALAFLNTRIYLRIKEVQKVRTNLQARNEPNYGATLASIIIIFIICHMPRIIKTIFEIVITNQIIASGEHCNGINPAKCLSNFNNFILTLNAASSFLIYCFVGSFGTKFAEVLTSCCRKQESVCLVDSDSQNYRMRKLQSPSKTSNINASDTIAHANDISHV